MPYNPSWLSAKRANQLAMAQKWGITLSQYATIWGVPASEVTELGALTTAADAALTAALTEERTTFITAKCKAAFDALVEKMRFIKSRYFLSPPLTDADFTLLDLKPKDTTHTPVPPPSGQAEADITRPGVHLLELHAHPTSETLADVSKGDYGFRIYYGIMPQGGASVEVATSPKRELMQVPISGDELPHSRFTRRKKERFDFDQADSGKMAYFCIRFENSKGESGPWGPMFSSIIP